jgi:thymidine kinase
MAKLYFRYGAMGSSKTANAIMVQHNYIERNQKVLMLKPRLDNRDGERTLRSRCGLQTECHFMEELDTLPVTEYNCIIVDEAQFLTKAQVETLVRLVDEDNIPVIAYGLRADFRNNLFEGSQWLLAWADTIEEVKTICWCGKKATCNTRVYDGKVVKEGDQIVLGGDNRYVSLCRRHWQKGELGPYKEMSMED